MPLGKTIGIYLVDGDPTGIQMIELSSWTGEAFVCQRSQLASLASRLQELHQVKQGCDDLVG